MHPEASKTGGGSLAIIGPTGRQIARLRGGLIRAAVDKGARVMALAPEMDPSGSSALLALGAETRPLALKATGRPFFRKSRARHALASELMNWGASAVLVFGSAVAPMAVRAAREARVARVVLLVSEIRDRRLDRGMIKAMRMADAVIVHNGDDLRLVEAAMGGPKAPVIRVGGAGADLRREAALPLPPLEGPVVFLAASRLEKVKGVLEFLEGARLALISGIPARFVLAGPEGLEKSAIGAGVISQYSSSVHYAGDAADLRAALQDAHVFVCPSHCEGMPHAVLQALAAGRPVLATDIPGSRDTVDENINGTLVQSGSAQALADAFVRLTRNKQLLPSMARASRAKAERNFSASAVHEAIFDALGIG